MGEMTDAIRRDQTNRAEKRLWEASFELGQAQRDLEEAERKFREALHAVELAEKNSLPASQQQLSIRKRNGNAGTD